MIDYFQTIREEYEPLFNRKLAELDSQINYQVKLNIKHKTK
jgi:hypothetical protein